jgi:fido (protein-threonine AMPylation protein)
MDQRAHTIICKSQDEYTVYTPQGAQQRALAKGTYKSMPNSPTLLDGRVHAYAPVADVIPEMQRLIDELRSESFLAAHPVLQAAYAHYAYVCIHPFADGNGRVSRALSSVFLYRSPGIPLVVFADQRNEYYDALESADQGDPFPFVRFVMVRAMDTIGIIRTMLQRSSATIDSALSGLHELFDSGADNEELHAAAIRLRNLATAEARSQFKALSLPTHLTINVVGGGIRYYNVPVPEGYQQFGDGFTLFQATSSWPHQLIVTTQFETFMKSSDAAASELLLASQTEQGLEVWLRELVPVETETVKLKVSAWIEGRVAELLFEIQQKIKGEKK